MSNGYTEHFIAVLDLATEKIVQRVPIAEGWMGLAVSPDGKSVYASGGSRDRILVYQLADGALTTAGEIALPKGTFPATPIRELPLFACFAEYLHKAAQKWGKVVRDSGARID